VTMSPPQSERMQWDYELPRKLAAHQCLVIEGGGSVRVQGPLAKVTVAPAIFASVASMKLRDTLAMFSDQATMVA
jgi:hypothetical protein